MTLPHPDAVEAGDMMLLVLEIMFLAKTADVECCIRSDGRMSGGGIQQGGGGGSKIQLLILQ